MSETVACALLAAHTPVHTSASIAGAANHSSGPKLERPKVDVGINEEEWNIFTRRWDAFVIGSNLNPNSCSSQLFQCAGETLGNMLLKCDPSVVSKPTSELKGAMKSMAVIAVATGVVRAELVGMQQGRDEPFRAFAARVRGKAETCRYHTNCSCGNQVDFTDIIIRDVLIAGISDVDIRRDVLGTDGILDKSVNDVVALVEGKEMARNALPPSAAGISGFKRQQKAVPPADKSKITPCPDCGKNYSLYTENASGWNKKPHPCCLNCFRLRRSKNRQKTKEASDGDGSSASDIGGIFAQVSSFSTPRRSQTKIVPCHHIFTKGGWRRARFLPHPEVELSVSAMGKDYKEFGVSCNDVSAKRVVAMTDSGAQSCLWSLDEFRAAGFTKEHLLDVQMNLVAANKSPITITGAALLRFSGKSSSGVPVTCACMVYISPQARGLYLSREAMVDLQIISPDFPAIGSANVSTVSGQSESATLNSTPSTPEETCNCPKREGIPPLPKELPFPCCEENNGKMESWLLDYFKSTTFNTCPHQQLPKMCGPPIEIHVDPNAPPRAVHTPAIVPLHWQEKVKADLLRDEALGVIERVPYGEPVTWCHRMVVTRKHDGTPRRTVDLSPLNKHCRRETFAVESPFNIVRRIPGDTWKTVCDAWNGFHSVPLRESDKHLTTFITPFGRWRYRRAPQGFVSSGDGYNRRFDAILADFERMERCIDDLLHHDTDLEEHWWRTIKLLIRLAESGVVLNPEKFAFGRKRADFAGFRVTESTIEPLPKYLDAIRNFPTPASTTDIRSWFGLVNQVSNYAKLSHIMAPFKPFLSPRVSFVWTPELESAFQKSKDIIVEAIKVGVRIFDPSRRTCLQTDWCKTGIGYTLSQKHCQCTKNLLPGCCAGGWKITLAGSRFLDGTEQRYAPSEGEALAIAWGLKQTRYFTQGCNDLLVVTDHQPLVKIFGDRTLDEITNGRLFRLKQKTLPWYFETFYLPGITNPASDATSRHPIGLPELPEDEEQVIAAAICRDTRAFISSITVENDPLDKDEVIFIAAIQKSIQTLLSLSWEVIADNTSKDPTLHNVLVAAENGFPDSLRDSNPKISQFWRYRESLYASDGVLMYEDRVVLPESLRPVALAILHSAHQGISAMEARARSLIFWPGITSDIHAARLNCRSCNSNAPSQASTPSTPQDVPSTPFEAVFTDFFKFAGYNYLLAGDRLSGWVEIYKAASGTSQAGSDGLIAALRSLFATFGVPVELSSDGGPEFIADKTEQFLARWGVHHRNSSSYFPQSNGRAEVAVKKCKRLLMDNIEANGSLNNDKLLRALLQVRNTPDPDCNISPAEILFGRPIRDAFSFINRKPKYDNPNIRSVWKEAWASKERALKARFSRSQEDLNMHTRALTPLSVGDKVFIQNQHGPHPNKWDRTGLVVEVGNFDQYRIKVDGSGRLTLRNRRFLRKYTPASTIIESGRSHLTDTSNLDLPVPESDKFRMPEMCLRLRQPPQSEEATPTAPVLEQPATQHPNSDLQGTTFDTSPAHQTDEATHEFCLDNPLDTKPQRPQRVRKSPKKYNAASGKWE